MQSSLKNSLEMLGLSRKEVEVYLASLRLGEASAQDIAHAAKLERTTAASILDRLVQQGFISIQTRKGKRIYWIEDPHLLVEQQKLRLTVAQELSNQLHVEYHQADHKSTAEIYDTKEGITQLILKAIEEMPKGSRFLTWESPRAKNYVEVLGEDLFEVLAKKKVAKGVFTRSLIPGGHEEDVREAALKHNIEVRVMPTGLNFEASVWLFGNSVVLFSGTDFFAVRVRNRHLYESLVSLFEFLWGLSAPFSK